MVRPCIFMSNGIGDFVMSLPTLRALLSRYPDATLLAPRRIAHMLGSNLRPRQLVDAVWHRAGALLRLDIAETQIEADGFVSLVPWFTPELRSLIRRNGWAETVGPLSEYKHHISPRRPCHAVDYTYAIAQASGVATALSQYSNEVSVPLASERQAEYLLKMLPAESRILAVHIDTYREKMWSVDRWCDVLRELVAIHEDLFVFVVGLAQCRLPSIPRVVSLLDSSLDVSAAVVSRVDVFAGVDSLFLHVADAAGVSGVALFGPTDPSEFGFRFSKGVHLQHSSKRVDAIPVADTLHAVDELLWQVQ